jgi:sulfite reductase alpha subunit-like flavoprotein
MPADVKKSLVEIITSNSTNPTLTPDDAERFLKKMEREKRFCVEAWS